MNLSDTTPILRILSESDARAFYVDFLGFRVDWEHRFADHMPLYMQISRDGCVLHLSEHRGDCEPGAAMRIQSDDIDGLHQELVARAPKDLHLVIKDTPWGSRDLPIFDPFKNRLTFTNAVTTHT